MNGDEWPRRNLGLGEHWGRTVEEALDTVFARLGSTGERVAGGNRNVASSSQTLANAITKTSDLADDIEDAILRTPRYFVRASSASGFAMGAWDTVLRIRQAAVEGFPNGVVSAIGTVYTEQELVATESFILPFPYSSVSSEYGPRPPLPFHNGIDFAQAGGTPIPSSSAGTVIQNRYDDEYGWYLRVDVSTETGVPGSWLGYAHMQSQSPHPVGATVSQGQILGPVGTTGFSTGNHLHWETAPGGDRINPRQFMDIFGGGSSTTTLEVQARIVINGVASPVFKPYAEVGLGPRQQNYPIFGRNFTSLEKSDVIDVALQVRTVGGTSAKDPANQATLTIDGAFSK